VSEICIKSCKFESGGLVTLDIGGSVALVTAAAMMI